MEDFVMNKSIKKFEDMIEGWLKPVPHLPDTWRKWLSENVWWLALIGVILSVIGLFGLGVALLAATSLVGVASYYGAYAPAAYAGIGLFTGFVSLIALALTATITAMAIRPLRLLNKKGWDLLFLAFLVGVVSQVVSAVLPLTGFVITNLLGAFISAAISAYFLFEIRSHFKKA
jgi:uncharacterized membrane protein YhaH (DUF805 family)